MDSFLSYRSLSREEEREIWLLERGIVPFVEAHWQDKGHGIWERRNEPKSYVTSRVMCWVAIDRAIKCVERFGFEGPVERWRPLRETIHEDVCRHGYSEELGAFREAYGEENLDASTLLIPLVGFLPPDDLRVVSNVETIRRELTEDGFVRRYDQGESKDGLPGREAHFIACSLWLADNLALMGRDDEAREIFERVLAVRNDLGLLAEQYDPADGCQLGNFPQAFSHVGIINTAHNLSHREGPAEHRSEKHRSEKGRTRTRPKHRNKPGA
jgi:GH15 family glucan-1,4-alpha-glucosidase